MPTIVKRKRLTECWEYLSYETNGAAWWTEARDSAAEFVSHAEAEYIAHQHGGAFAVITAETPPPIDSPS